MTDDLLAFVASRRGHFKTESGLHANLWMDLETLCWHPNLLRPSVARLAAMLRPHDPDVVCGPLNEGAFVALMVAAELDCQFIYTERFVDAGAESLFPVRYRLSPPFRRIAAGRRVAIVNDVISAGSAVRGTLEDLTSAGAQVIAIGALVVLGRLFDSIANERGIPIEALERAPFEMWKPDECPLCAAGVPLESVDALGSIA